MLNVIPAGQDSPVFIKPDAAGNFSTEQILVQRVLDTDTINIAKFGFVALQQSDD